jgi:hypothetical protein
MTINIHPDAARWGGWHWEPPQRGEHFRRCSFCGSIHPEDLAAEPEWTPSWADMKYGWPHKFYADIPNREPNQLYVTSASQNQYTEDYIPLEQLTDEQRAVAERDAYLRDDDPWTHFQFGHRRNHFGKFYTVHLADDQIADSVAADVEQRSGLAFTFEVADGEIARVYWRDANTDDAPPPV